MAVAKKRGLGKGLDALLSLHADVKPTDSSIQLDREESFRHLPIEWLRPGQYQPRCDMSQDKLEELAQSIREQGVIQPILVRPIDVEQFEIIAGERRWRASQLVPLETVPCVIKNVSPESSAIIALIENVQREDLNAIEQASALERLQNEFKLTHQDIAQSIGKSRSAVTNMLRLNQLHDQVKKQLESGDLEMGHARALLTLPASQQAEVGRLIAHKGLNVRETENLTRKMQAQISEKADRYQKIDINISALQEDLSACLGTEVLFNHRRSGQGQLIIRYQSLEQIDPIIEALKKRS